jgi:uncharacterized membrane protein YfhO
LAVFGNGSALPRAFVVAQTAGGTRDQALQTIRSPQFDPRRQAVLEAGPAISGSGGPWPAVVAAESENRLELDVNAPQPGALVVSTPYYPGWKAAVDGHPVNLYRADFVFQGLELPAGQHHVELRFDPLIFILGAVVSLIGWVALVAFVARGFMR